MYLLLQLRDISHYSPVKSYFFLMVYRGGILNSSLPTSGQDVPNYIWRTIKIYL